MKDNGATIITPKNKKEKTSFEIEIEIPHYENKDTCMLRINFAKTSFLTIRIYDSEKRTIIDFADMSLPNSITPIDLSPDFFIPASESRKIYIQFFGKEAFSIKNIELWYY